MTPPMPQGEYIVTMLFLTFLIFITVRGNLVTYIRLLV
jgi:hypothetical protein